MTTILPVSNKLSGAPSFINQPGQEGNSKVNFVLAVEPEKKIFEIASAVPENSAVQPVEVKKTGKTAASDPVKTIENIRFWAVLRKIERDLKMLPSSQKELADIIESAAKGDQEAKRVLAFMTGKTPLEKLVEIQNLFKVFQEGAKNLKAGEKKRESLATLSAWLQLKTFEIVKNDEIANKANSKELLAQLKAGNYQSDILKTKIAAPAPSIVDDPQRPLDSLLYSILRAVAFENEQKRDIAKKVPGDEEIKDAVKKVGLKDKEKEAALIKEYQKNFRKLDPTVLSWANVYYARRLIEDYQEKAGIK